MKLRIEHGLLFVQVSVVYRGHMLRLQNVLLDAGSAGTLFSVDRLVDIGLGYEPQDRVHRIRGVVGRSSFLLSALNR